MQTLYGIADEATKIWDILREADGELTQELEQRLDDLLVGAEWKLDNAVAVVRHLQSLAEECRAESERLKARAATIEADMERLKGRILFAVDALGGKVKTAKNTIWGQNSPEVTDYQVAPDADLATIALEHPEAVRASYALNKTALKNLPVLPKAITATVRPGTRSLRIK